MTRYRRRRRQPELNSLVIVLIVFAFGYTFYQQQHAKALIFGVVLLCALGVAAGLQIYLVQQRRRRLIASGIAQIDVMTGEAFERYMKLVFERWGYSQVRLTEKYDLGVDLIAVKNGVVWGVQFKRYNRLVKAEAVRQVVTGLNHYHCERAMVVTNSRFSEPAKKLAASNSCVLIDRDELIKRLAAA